MANPHTRLHSGRHRRGVRRAISLLALIVALGSCSGVADRTVAEQEVIEFHRAFNEQKFASLYEAAAPGFKKQRSRDEFIALMEAAHQSFGPVQSAYLRDWRSSLGYGGVIFTTVTFDTTFSNATATETFTFLTSPRDPTLISYNISSGSKRLQ